MRDDPPIPALPSLVTLGNTACGFLAVVLIAEHQFVLGAWMIFAAMIFDVLDGKIARMTRQTSRFGVHLDSLSDVVSFGVAPAFLVKVFVIAEPVQFQPKVAWVCAVLFLVCAVMRLARFNVESEGKGEAEAVQGHDHFSGLPVPAAAGTIAAMVLLYFSLPMDGKAWVVWLLPFQAVVVGALMIGRIRYVHLFNRYFRERRSFSEMSHFLFVVVFAALIPEIVLTACFFGYALGGPFTLLWLKMQGFGRRATASGEEAAPAPAPVEEET